MKKDELLLMMRVVATSLDSIRHEIRALTMATVNLTSDRGLGPIYALQTIEEQWNGSDENAQLVGNTIYPDEGDTS